MKSDRESCGNEALDALLGGGLERKTITQLFGEPASGKTTLCLIAAVTCLRAGQFCHLDRFRWFLSGAFQAGSR